MSKAIGIDLGTTFSCVAIVEDDKQTVIPNDQGMRTTPSCVGFTDTDCLIGMPALNMSARNPTNSVFDAKRLIGRKFNDKSVQEDIKHWPFKVVADKDGLTRIEVTFKKEMKQFKPEEVSSMILLRLKAFADEYLGADGPVEAAVITVPAYFNQLQRQATVDAGNIAGLKIKAIINEPTAAAIAYGNQFGNDVEKNIFIFDLGGGTFDVSIVKLIGGKFEVLGTSGDTHLGGIDLDHCILTYVIEQFKQNEGIDVSDNAKAIRRLKTQVEKQKCVLSTATESEICVDALAGGEDCSVIITRKKFEQLAEQSFFSKIVPVNDAAMKAKNLKKEDISDVVLVGGTTRVPRVKEILSEYFPNHKIVQSINPDEAVAVGAAIHAHNLPEDATHEEVFETNLKDVTPLDQGIRAGAGGKRMAVVIPKNSTYPMHAEKKFTNSRDNQTVLKLSVLQGESEIAEENLDIGNFSLNIPPKPKGQNEIHVKFEIDGNGLLTVSATEQSQGETAEIQIDNAMANTPEEIAEMRVRALTIVRQNTQNEALLKAKYELDTLTNEINTAGGKVTDEADSAIVEELVDMLENFAKESPDANADEINEKIKEIKEFFDPIKEKL